jgi:hypothetical protein
MMSNTIAPDAWQIPLEDVFNAIGTGYYKVLSDETPFFAYRVHDEDVWLVKTAAGVVERFTSAGLQHAAVFPYPIDDLYRLLNMDLELPDTVEARYDCRVKCASCGYDLCVDADSVYCINSNCKEHYNKFKRPTVTLTRIPE